jgi:hypothetical protein
MCIDRKHSLPFAAQNAKPHTRFPAMMKEAGNPAFLNRHFLAGASDNIVKCTLCSGM